MNGQTFQKSVSMINFNLLHFLTHEEIKNTPGLSLEELIPDKTTIG
jgi:hypothetical protein